MRRWSSLPSVGTRSYRWVTAFMRFQPTIPHLKRSSLHHYLQRHGVGFLPDVEGSKSAKKKFKSHPIGYFHIDIAEVQTAQGKLYLFVAIDHTSRFAFVQLVERANQVTASAFLLALIAAVPYKIHTCSRITASSSGCPTLYRWPERPLHHAHV